MVELVNGSSEIDEKYDLSGPAYVLVLHHYKFSNSKNDRPGSKKDMKKIREFFGGYRTEPANLDVHDNLNVRQVQDLMDAVSQKDFSTNSCLIVIIMSHGDEDDIIVAHDGKGYYLNRGVLEKVAVNQTLDGKPKIFIVNACRGPESVLVAPPPVFMAARQVTGVPRSDTVMFQSTYEGHLSYRNRKNGSFFVQTFFNLLRRNDHINICNLSEMLNKLAAAKAGSIQNPMMTSTLRNRLIFRDLRKEEGVQT